jgi:membrane protease YdiL (CAAX protease family)
MDKLVKNGKLLGYDLNLVVVVTVSTLVLVLERYHPISLDFPQSSEIIYYMLIPLATGLLLLLEKPWDYGIRIGNWRSSLVLTTVCLAAMVAIVYASSRMAEFTSYYQRTSIDWSDLLLKTALYMFAWEFIFRGYMLFGLEKSIGKNAIFVQNIPFVLLHVGKPLLETLSCIPSGFFFGYISYRTRSFLPAFIVHFGLNISMMAFTNL